MAWEFAVCSHKDSIPIHARLCRIERLQRAAVNEIVKDKGLPFIQYIGPAEKAVASLTYKPILHLQAPYILPPETELNQGIQEKSLSMVDIAVSEEFLKLEENLAKYKAILAE